jgi:hypothetical protein
VPKKPTTDPIPPKATILQWLELSVEELTQVIRENPSLRGMILGYVAEFQCRKIFAADPRVKNLTKDDDHDRTAKGDLRFNYHEFEFRIEVKSLQTGSIRPAVEGLQSCKYQCDASDRRPVYFSDRSTVETTSLLVGEFDLVAVNMFAVSNHWTFGFARNDRLPRSTHKAYTELQRRELLASTMPVTWPLTGIYRSDPFSLLDELAAERRRQPPLPLS